MYILDQTKPHQKHFEAISRIPHPSAGEKGVSDYITAHAKQLGLSVTQDKLWNVVVKKPASAGYEDAPVVMLQAHMDMVTVKAPGSSHDFDKDPLKLYVDDEGNVRAEGTTLGADDAYGVAYLLAVMDEEFPHPALELVFTSQEENGCDGVDYLDTDQLASRRMIGLDVMGSDHENVCVVGCFYSDKMTASTKYACDAVQGNALKITLSGLQPVRTVHAAHPEQFNAIKLMARLLHGLNGIRVASMNGGEAENYSPLETECVIVCDDVSVVRKELLSRFEAIDDELKDGVQQMRMDITSARTDAAATQAETRRILDLLFMMPCNCVELDPVEETMTQFNNVGIVTMNNGEFSLVMSDRTARKSYLIALRDRVETLCRLCGMELETSVRYASWDYNKDSYLLNATAQLMKEFYGREMEESICPGGLECCSLIPRMPGLDVVMFAPIGNECHSTNEYLNLESFDRVYEFLKTLLGRLKK